MNRRQLKTLGVPDAELDLAVRTLQQVAQTHRLRGKELKNQMSKVIEAPHEYLTDELMGEFARALISSEQEVQMPTEPISYRTWGTDIDQGSHDQMKMACLLPSARGAAMMPDAHIGYGLPIGGVLALENAVVPYAVGVDIACRMKLSVLDVPVETLSTRTDYYKSALENGTVFGVGRGHEKPQHHAVLDEDWTITRITRENKDKARNQLGSSGSGNHFVEFGVLTLATRHPDWDLEPGSYLALMSHSGSRGAGAAVCSTYSAIAQSRLPKNFQKLGRLAWLEMDSEAGQEYWAAMNLMGEYAAANHAIIHRNVSKLVGAHIIAGVENHHNFAWKEMHQGKELIVHRKGATPAGVGVLGVIPGSMADPAYVVSGRGNDESFHSASHGAGRCMSRTKALEKYNFKAVKNDLAAKGISIISAGADEVPGVYKNINEVMAQQTDLVEIVARFNPKIVKMCGDGSKAED
jgi:tRNA-splicing ligase RtcB